MAMKGPYREFIPVGEQIVKVRLPEGAHARKIHLLVAGQTARVQHRGADITITVPSVLDHEVVAIDI
jgi:hypothetical protein